MKRKQKTVPLTTPVYRSVISSKGQLVIPAELRAQFGLKKGAPVILAPENGHIKIEPIDWDAIRALRGSTKGSPSGLDILREERRRDREHEDRLH